MGRWVLSTSRQSPTPGPSLQRQVGLYLVSGGLASPPSSSAAGASQVPAILSARVEPTLTLTISLHSPAGTRALVSTLGTSVLPDLLQEPGSLRACHTPQPLEIPSQECRGSRLCPRARALPYCVRLAGHLWPLLSPSRAGVAGSGGFSHQLDPACPLHGGRTGGHPLPAPVPMTSPADPCLVAGSSVHPRSPCLRPAPLKSVVLPPPGELRPFHVH